MEKLYNMSEFSKLVGLNSSTIRYYDSLNLLFEVRRDENNYRVFTEGNIICIETIKKLKEIGYELNDLVAFKEVIDNINQTGMGPLSKMLDIQAKKLDAMIEDLTEKKQKLAELELSLEQTFCK